MEDSKVVQNLMYAATIGLLGWNVYTTQQLSVDVAIISTNMENTNTIVNRSIVNNSTIARLETGRQLLESRIERLEQWNQNLSNRLAATEEGIQEVLTEIVK